ncbi:protein kinase domain-containing protein [Nocardia huaxiensis]|uniref:non-specific serine/threonine protein kinase n=1 Tax=Nocardia huaxiensis TaxID=2755382 RepID=A0A7D6ZH67_9NOCA|nr:protein kinase [Nocardia huaxiensis]QLY29660.1 protein kinase [Nocardia huaxiensis]UFS96766.1 protein kinase [Nocardia huaxiensis]
MVQLVARDSFAGYSIEGVLGTGGMGTVYLARHPRLPRSIALKLLHSHISADPDLRRRFEQESEIAARLDHPGIVGVHDCGNHDGLLWIAMQYIPGTDASRLESRSVTVERALRIISETAAALDYAHSREILHRDIKPANILLSAAEPGRAERAILTDFGIARLLNAGTAVTATGTFTATLDYASPEQLNGQTVDGRTDQYSLACTLFALLSGSAPFHAPSPGQVVAGHIGKKPPRLSSLRPGLPQPLDEVVLRAMAKDPADRFANCTEFATAALAAVNGKPATHAPAAQDTPTGLAALAAWAESSARAESSAAQQGERTDAPASAGNGSARHRAESPARRAARAESATHLAQTESPALSTPAASLAAQVPADAAPRAGGDGSPAARAATQPPAPWSAAMTSAASRAGSAAASASRAGAAASRPASPGSRAASAGAPPSASARLESAARQPNRKALVAAAMAAVIATGGAVVALDMLSSDTQSTAAEVTTIPVGKGNDGDIAIDSASQRAYVVNSVDNTVTVIDTRSRTVAATVGVGEYPRGVALDSAARTAYVINSVSAVGNQSTVSVLDMTTNTVTATIPTGKNSTAIAFDSGTHSLFVVDKNDTAPADQRYSLTVIDPAAKTVTATIPLGSVPAEAVTIDSSTHTAYVTTRTDRAVKVVDTVAHTVRATIPLQAHGDTYDRITIDTGRRTLYITDGTTITLVDTGTNAILHTIELDISSARMDQAQRNVAIDPKTGTAYAVGPFNGVQVVDTVSRSVTGEITVPTSKGISVDPATHDVYVNSGSGYVSVLDR